MKEAQSLRYSDLYSGGLLTRRVKLFTFFDTVEQNDAWLELINFADGSPGSFTIGNGLCKNVRQYSKVSFEERLGKIPPPSLDPWSRACQTLGWKNCYLLFFIYAKSGATMMFVATIGGVNITIMSNIFVCD